VFTFDPSLVVFHHRRPFGLSYIRQRFRLRQQSARLFVAYPGVYIRNVSFIAVLLVLPLVILAFFLVPLFHSGPGILFLAMTYCALSMVLSFQGWRSRPLLALVAPPVFFIHHAVYVVGLWQGILMAIISPKSLAREEKQLE